MGKTQIFILPMVPENGTGQLIHCGSMRDLSDEALVTDILLRGGQYRGTWLAAAQTKAPEQFRIAQALERDLCARAAKWPHLEWDGESFLGGTDSGTAIAHELDSVSLDAIFMASAINWLSSGAENWSTLPLWDLAIHVIAHARRAEAHEVERGELQSLLRDCPLSDGERMEYLEAWEKSARTPDLDFPYRGPDRYGSLSGSDRLVTVDFIVRFSCFERGWMYARYCMSDELEMMDTERIKPMITALLSSPDEVHQWIGENALRRSKDKRQYVNLVLQRLLTDSPQAWLALVEERDPDKTAAQLRLLIDMARRNSSTQDFSQFWLRLASGACFEEPVLQEAIQALTTLESTPSTSANPTDDAANRELRVAFSDYLAAAARERSPGGPLLHSASEYRAWFNDHPKRK